MSRSDGNGVPWRGILVAVVVGYGFGYMHGERGERHDCRERVASLPWEVPKARRLRQLLHQDSYLLDNEAKRHYQDAAKSTRLTGKHSIPFQEIKTISEANLALSEDARRLMYSGLIATYSHVADYLDRHGYHRQLEYVRSWIARFRNERR